jgi:hypothetical protein
MENAEGVRYLQPGVASTLGKPVKAKGSNAESVGEPSGVSYV